MSSSAALAGAASGGSELAVLAGSAMHAGDEKGGCEHSAVYKSQRSVRSHAYVAKKTDNLELTCTAQYTKHDYGQGPLE